MTGPTVVASSCVLVAGAAGFLGSHLVDALLAKDWTVIGVDSYLTGKPENLVSASKQPRFVFCEHDITHSLPAAITSQLITHIANLACPASPTGYQAHPLETLHASSAGVENLLELAKQKQARFTQTSTSEVYGDPTEHPQKESYWGNVNSYGVRSCYDEGKRYAEALIYTYRRSYGVNTGITRIFNTYGPRMQPDDGRVMTNFIVAALKGEPITVYGDGSQTRSFCFVDDQIQAQIAMLESGVEGPVNIGNPHECTILALAHEIIKLTQSTSQIIFQPLPGDDPKKRRPDITKAKQELLWEPKITLAAGLARMIEWVQQQQTS